MHVIGRHRQSATYVRVPVYYMAATDADVPGARGHRHDMHNLAGIQSTDTDVQACAMCLHACSIACKLLVISVRMGTDYEMAVCTELVSSIIITAIKFCYNIR